MELKSKTQSQLHYMYNICLFRSTSIGVPLRTVLQPGADLPEPPLLPEAAVGKGQARLGRLGQGAVSQHFKFYWFGIWAISEKKSAKKTQKITENQKKILAKPFLDRIV